VFCETKSKDKIVDVILEDDSILYPNNIKYGIWSMTKSQVTCHASRNTESMTVHVFSTDPNSIHELEYKNQNIDT